MKADVRDALRTFLAAHPEIEFIEMVWPDMNGLMRGELLPAARAWGAPCVAALGVRNRKAVVRAPTAAGPTRGWSIASRPPELFPTTGARRSKGFAGSDFVSAARVSDVEHIVTARMI